MKDCRGLATAGPRFLFCSPRKRHMRLKALTILAFIFLPLSTASADWRWAKPKFKPTYVAVMCDTPKCITVGKQFAKERYKKKVRAYNKRKLREWRRVTSQYIPRCTWYGESGHGPEYARHRYTMPNAGGSGAYGKFQFMSSTYFSVAKYGDWSPLDQEIAARREYGRHGTSPWTNCW